jgi:hypothetical protein
MMKKKIDIFDLFMGAGVLILVFGLGYLALRAGEFRHIERMAMLEHNCEQKEQPQ